MKATDLKQPGDFHQITHQIRELVAYAISQLENAQAGGVQVSGRFAAFLLDAASKTPGYTGPGNENLLPHQFLLEDGGQIPMKGEQIAVSVAGGTVTGAQFVKPTVCMAKHGERLYGLAGGQYIDTSAVVENNLLMGTEAAQNNFALVVDGAQLPMHDMAGHGGTITAKVSGNVVTDMQFSTDRVHLIRHRDRSQLSVAGVLHEVVYNIAQDNTGAWSFTQSGMYAVQYGASVRFGEVAEAVGTFAGMNSVSKTVQVTPVGYVAAKNGANVQVCNKAQPPGDNTVMAISRFLKVGEQSYVVLEDNGFCVKNGRLFGVGADNYRAVVTDGRIQSLTKE